MSDPLDGRPWRILSGDVREVLRTLPDGYVQTCVTSPPYWGLRDYGVSGQLGLEPTPEAYVANMVEVFREVRRALRDDGTMWLNLGSSYASGDTAASPSPLLRRAPACDSDGTEPQGSQAVDRACLGSDDAPQAESRSRRGRNARSAQFARQADGQTSPTARDNEHADCGQASPCASPLGAHPSTTRQSCDPLPGGACREATASACPRGPQTVPLGAPGCEHTSACTCDTSRMSQPLEVRSQGKESFFSACRRSDCRGIGRCGLCWCNMAIGPLKRKDLVPTPWLVALALQADGWYLRADILWTKPNPMPSSVTDRPTKAHEYVFLLAKSERYFWDQEAVREALISDGRGGLSNKATLKSVMHGENHAPSMIDATVNPAGRNIRSVWTITTKPYSEAHFATFPPELPERCIKAGTSEKGCCAVCGAPWERVTDRVSLPDPRPPTTGAAIKAALGDMARTTPQGRNCGHVEVTTTGWRPTCSCPPAAPIPCVVLDPFAGAGTTLMVARRLQRRALGIELNPKYVELAERRIDADAPLFNRVA